MKLAIVAAVLTAVALPVTAQTNTPNIDQREANQQARIQQGIQSGQLTSQEANHLENGQAHVQAMEDKAKADGKVTRAERQKLIKAEDKQSHRIYRKKHNAKTTTPAG